jgi:tetratricopeptide (TPR) repeat protein
MDPMAKGSYRSGVEKVKYAVRLCELDNSTQKDSDNLFLQDLEDFLFQQALEDFDRALLLEPGYAAAYFERGKIHEQMGNIDEALCDYARALQYKTDYLDVLIARAEIYSLYHRDVRRAIVDLTQAIELCPSLASLYLARANCFKDTDKTNNALVDLDHALTLNPKYAECYQAKGEILFAMEQFRQAAHNFTRALECNVGPYDGELLFQRGVALMECAEYIRALEDFNAILHSETSCADAYLHRGDILLRLGKPEEAKDDLLAAIKLFKQFGDDDSLKSAQQLLKSI